MYLALIALILVLGFIFYREGSRNLLVVMSGIAIMLLTEHFGFHVGLGLAVYALTIFLIYRFFNKCVKSK
jgi:hypothetical protein